MSEKERIDQIAQYLEARVEALPEPPREDASMGAAHETALEESSAPVADSPPVGDSPPTDDDTTESQHDEAAPIPLEEPPEAEIVAPGASEPSNEAALAQLAGVRGQLADLEERHAALLGTVTAMLEAEHTAHGYLSGVEDTFGEDFALEGDESAEAVADEVVSALTYPRGSAADADAEPTMFPIEELWPAKVTAYAAGTDTYSVQRLKASDMSTTYGDAVTGVMPLNQAAAQVYQVDDIVTVGVGEDGNRWIIASEGAAGLDAYTHHTGVSATLVKAGIDRVTGRQGVTLVDDSNGGVYLDALLETHSTTAGSIELITASNKLQVKVLDDATNVGSIRRNASGELYACVVGT